MVWFTINLLLCRRRLVHIRKYYGSRNHIGYRNRGCRRGYDVDIMDSGRPVFLSLLYLFKSTHCTDQGRPNHGKITCHSVRWRARRLREQSSTDDHILFAVVITIRQWMWCEHTVRLSKSILKVSHITFGYMLHGSSKWQTPVLNEEGLKNTKTAGACWRLLSV